VRHDARAGFTLESELLVAAAMHGYATVAVPIDTVYAGGRPSHFRPVRDIARIVRMVARRLIAARMHPVGLWRTLSERPLVLCAEAAGRNGAESTIRRRRGAFASSRSRSLP
jgi:hypothetical protein